MNFVEACRKFIAIDSSPEVGSRELAEFAAKHCEERGLYVDFQEEHLGDLTQANVIARPLGSRPSVEFMLQTHLDTPDPGPYGLWKHNESNPFDATIIDNKIYGLGAADVKLDFLCKLEAITSFGSRPFQKMPPVLVATFGEEAGMQGALRLIRKNKVSAKMALIGEPSDLGLITAAKGFAIVEMTVPFSDEEKKYRDENNLHESTMSQSRLFHGKPAHSSTPHLGESAVTKMFEYLGQLPERVVVMEADGGISANSVPAQAVLEVDLVSSIRDPISKKLLKIFRAVQDLEREFQIHLDHEFTPPHPTLNIGVVRTTEDAIVLGGSCRMPPVISQEKYEEWMGFLKTVAENVGGEFKVLDYKRPFRTPSNSMLVRGCLDELRKLGLEARCLTQPNTNEASLFSRIGIECVGFGAAPRDHNLHSPHEHVSIEALNKSIEFYKHIIERFCV